jgi:hypothetical protein
MIVNIEFEGVKEAVEAVLIHILFFSEITEKNYESPPLDSLSAEI